MISSPRFVIRLADWNTDRAALRSVREQVFVHEQSVPLEIELDELDPLCRHVLAEAEGVAIGTGRLLPDGHIGRMAVLRDWRGAGVGGALLQELMALARRLGHQRVVLNAQTQALPFYLRFGFTPEGEEFLDAGIPHRRMWKSL